MRVGPAVLLSTSLLLGSGCARAHERPGASDDVCGGLSRPSHPLGAPTLHRPFPTACPAERGAIASDPACEVASDPSCAEAACVVDADCTAGPNGRCSHLHRGPASLRLFCTYDECARDDDCAEGACACRASASSSEANDCLSPSECRTDADCGANGFCSPSLVGMGFCACPTYDLCGDTGPHTGCTVSIDGGPPTDVPCLCGDTCAPPGFYCHTPCDECANDEDCTGRGFCLFDARERRFACRAAICTSGP